MSGNCKKSPAGANQWEPINLDLNIKNLDDLENPKKLDIDPMHDGCGYGNENGSKI